MNRKQKACILVGIAVIVVMGLYPPWVIQIQHISLKFQPEPGPYSWIGSPPEEESRFVYNSGGKRKVLYLTAKPRFIDLYRLGVQYFIVAVVTAGLIITLRDRKTG